MEGYMEFKAFEKIEKFKGITMTITQKIHGTNAQIRIFEITDESQVGGKVPTVIDGKAYYIQASSRTRDIFPWDDNYGFARFVDENKQELIEKLGPGTHYGEWAGPGINSGEGLKEKTFVIFNHYRFPAERPLPKQCVVVPVLYEGHYDYAKIIEVADQLKENGSKLVPGFIHVEGIVIEVAGKRHKKVFTPEETQWTRGHKGPKPEKIPGYDASHLLQPIRLEKLLSKDERYMKHYPQSLSDICRDYVQDLIDEGQIAGTEDEIRSIKKSIGGQVFPFIREFIAERNLDI
jgi:hypothetical protein